MCVLCGGKKERTKRFRCVPLVPPARDPKKNANAHFVSFFDERKNSIAKIEKIVQSKKERKETLRRRELSFFCPTHNFPLFCGHFFPRNSPVSLSVELYHPRKYYSHHERQRFDVYEDDTNDDVLLLRILFPVFFFFFFETVEANWTEEEGKEGAFRDF